MNDIGESRTFTDINIRMCDRILDDLKSTNSLILSKLSDRVARILELSGKRELTIKDVIPFLKIHNDGITKIEASNMRETLKDILEKCITNKRYNMRAISNSPRTSFSLPELLMFCELLKLNPESILLDKDAMSFLLPLQYCTRENIHKWIENASYVLETENPVRIPFRSAPLLGVFLDIYFMIDDNTNDSRRDLDNRIGRVVNGEGSVSLHVVRGNVEQGKCVKMKIILTVRTGSEKKRFVHYPFTLAASHTNDTENDMKYYLEFADSCFFYICRIKYNDEKKYINDLRNFSGDNAITEFYSDAFAGFFDEYLECNRVEEDNKAYNESYTNERLNKLMRKYCEESGYKYVRSYGYGR